MVTDKLGSYRAAKANLAPGLEHRRHKGINSKSADAIGPNARSNAEASHRHTRRREKIMARFKSPRQGPRFLSVHDQTAVIFRPHRHRLFARSYRHATRDALDLWSGYAAELTT